MSALNSTSNIDVGSYPTHALIREADGLTSDEKLLLHTVASGEHRKVNDKSNDEDIKNLKPRRVRPPRRERPANPDRGMLTTQQDRVRSRIAGQRERWRSE